MSKAQQIFYLKLPQIRFLRFPILWQLGKQILILLLTIGWSIQTIQSQNIPYYPLSDLANEGCADCKDTVKFLFIKKVFDLSLLLPEWKPVVNFQHSEVLEGTVAPWSNTFIGCHVSQVDFSGYHYTHDFGFDVVPDPGYDRICARRIYDGTETGHNAGTGHIQGKADTILQKTVHVEWESGLVSGNEGNPCAEANLRGESCGFFSAGHKRRETIWNWPAIGDWVHVEGLWIWDRGHPPGRTELHPLRLCVTRRAQPEWIPHHIGSNDSIHATRFDMFCSGEGGALMNNRDGVPPFVKPCKMGGKDYRFTLRPNQSRPSKSAVLRYRIETRNGDNFPNEFIVKVVDDSLMCTIPWQTADEQAVFARSMYCWWEDDGNQVIPIAKVHRYEVSFDHLYFNRRKDGLSRPELIIFLEFAGNYINLNEFVEGDNILRDGAASSFKRLWPVNLKFQFSVEEGKPFRIHIGGWEADGISRAIGHLIDPASPCDKQTKKLFHKHLWPATPFGLHGCLDDDIGEIHDFYLPDTLPQLLERMSKSKGDKEGYEQCPGVNTDPNDVFRAWYSIRRID